MLLYGEIKFQNNTYYHDEQLTTMIKAIDSYEKEENKEEVLNSQLAKKGLEAIFDKKKNIYHIQPLTKISPCFSLNDPIICDEQLLSKLDKCQTYRKLCHNFYAPLLINLYKKNICQEFKAMYGSQLFIGQNLNDDNDYVTYAQEASYIVESISLNNRGLQLPIKLSNIAFRNQNRLSWILGAALGEDGKLIRTMDQEIHAMTAQLRLKGYIHAKFLDKITFYFHDKAHIRYLLDSGKKYICTKVTIDGLNNKTAIYQIEKLAKYEMITEKNIKKILNKHNLELKRYFFEEQKNHTYNLHIHVSPIGPMKKIKSIIFSKFQLNKNILFTLSNAHGICLGKQVSQENVGEFIGLIKSISGSELFFDNETDGNNFIIKFKSGKRKKQIEWFKESTSIISYASEKNSLIVSPVHINFFNMFRKPQSLTIKPSLHLKEFKPVLSLNNKYTKALLNGGVINTTLDISTNTQEIFRKLSLPEVDNEQMEVLDFTNPELSVNYKLKNNLNFYTNLKLDKICNRQFLFQTQKPKQTSNMTSKKDDIKKLTQKEYERYKIINKIGISQKYSIRNMAPSYTDLHYDLNFYNRDFISIPSISLQMKLMNEFQTDHTSQILNIIFITRLNDGIGLDYENLNTTRILCTANGSLYKKHALIFRFFDTLKVADSSFMTPGNYATFHCGYFINGDIFKTWNSEKGYEFSIGLIAYIDVMGFSCLFIAFGFEINGSFHFDIGMINNIHNQRDINMSYPFRYTQ